MSRDARNAAMASGILPHEFLLAVARGERIKQLVPVGTQTIDGVEEQLFAERWLVPDFEKRMDAAKAAAPYYAPKISTVEVITGVSDDELDAIIASAAAEAGVSIGNDGEGEESEAEEREAVSPRKRIRV
jgi:hypothetical protein